MHHQDLLFVDRDGHGATQRAVISRKATDGSYQLSIRAKAAVGTHCKQAYCFVWCGQEAEQFYTQHYTALQAGQPLHAQWGPQQAINNTIFATATLISLAPRATPKPSTQAA
jgi:hypothetical protein